MAQTMAMESGIKTNRDWDFIRETEKLNYLLLEKLKTVRFYLKDTEPPAEFYIGEQSNGAIVFHCPPDVEPSEAVTLYSTLKRQVEIDFKLIDRPEPGTVHLAPVEGRISKIDREFPRFNNDSDAIHAANFQVSKSEIAVDHTRSHVANKVIFNEFEKRLHGEFPGLKIYEYGTRERPQATKYLNKKKDVILVSNVSDFATYRSSGEGVVDYYDLLETEDEMLPEKVRKAYLERQLQSVLVQPLLYEMADGTSLPIAFFYLEVKQGAGPLDMSAVERLKDVGEDVIHRIEDASLITVKEKQAVINISEGGVALEFTQPDLVKYVPQRRTITFDLVFRMQAPLRFRGKVCHIHEAGPGRVVVGVNLDGTGHSDFRTGTRDRLRSLIRMLKS
jgi:hypothetical protein